MSALLDERRLLADSALRMPGNDKPPSDSPPTLKKLRLDIPSQKRPPGPEMVNMIHPEFRSLSQQRPSGSDDFTHAGKLFKASTIVQ